MQLTATAASGYAFDHWEGELGESTNPASVTMNANKQVTAVFAATSTQQTIVNSDLTGGSNSTKPPTLPGWTFGIVGTWENLDYDAYYFDTYGGRSGVIWFANNTGGNSGDQVWMEQTVTVPVNAASLEVNGSNTGFGAYPYQANGTLQVLINGSLVAQKSPQNTTEFNLSVNLSSYRGQTVTIRIMRPQISTGYNIVFIDSVKILT